MAKYIHKHFKMKTKFLLCAFLTLIFIINTIQVSFSFSNNLNSNLESLSSKEEIDKSLFISSLISEKKTSSENLANNNQFESLSQVPTKIRPSDIPSSKFKTSSLDSINPIVFSGIQSQFVNVSKSNFYDATPTLFMGLNSRLWITWAVSNNTSATDADVLLAYSDDNGNTWTNPIWVTSKLGVDEHTYGLVDKFGSIWIFFTSEPTQGGNQKNIWYKKSSDSGITWSPEVQLTTGVGSKNFPAAFFDKNDTLWIVYSFSQDIYFIQSFNFGTSWSSPQKMNPSTSNNEQIWDAYVSDNGTIFLSVEEFVSLWGQFIWISTDNGLTWIKKQATAYDGSRGGSFALDSNGVYYLAVGKPDSQLYIYNSTDYGNSWTIGTQLTYSGSHGQVSIYIDKYDNFYLVTNEFYSTDNYDVEFLRLSSGYNSIFRDDFNDGQIDNWKINNGSWIIENGKLKFTNDLTKNDPLIMAPINVIGDWEASIDMFWVSGTYFEGQFMLDANFTKAPQHFWDMFMSTYPNPDSLDISYYQLNPFSVSVKSSTPENVVQGIWYKFMAKREGANLSFYLNNNLIYSEYNAFDPGISFGLSVYSASTVYFDNFKVLYNANYNFNITNFTGDENNITNNPTSQHKSSMTTDNLGRLWVAFDNDTSITNSNGDIVVMYSNNNGDSFSVPMKLTTFSGLDRSPSIITDTNGRMWIFWFSSRFSTSWDIMYKYSDDNGQTWSIDYQLTNFTGEEFDPRATLDKFGNILVYFTYNDGLNGKDIYYKEYFKNGTWDSAKKISISNTNEEEIYSAFTSANGTIYLYIQELVSLWAVKIWKSNDNGVTWTSAQATTYNNLGWGSAFEVNGVIHVLYSTTSQSLYYINSTDLITWSSPILLTSGQLSQISIDDFGTLFLVYQSTKTGNDELFLKRFYNFAPINQINQLPPPPIDRNLYDLTKGEIHLLNDTAWNYLPHFFEDKVGKLWLFYENATSVGSTDYDMYGIYSLNKGDLWSDPISIAKTPVIDGNPTPLLAPDGTIWIFYYSNFANANFDIWAVNSTDNGLTWNSPLQITNSTFSDTLDSGGVFIAPNGTWWLLISSNRGGGIGYNIFYMTSNNQGSTWSIPIQFPLSSTSVRENIYNAMVTPNGTIIVNVDEVNTYWAAFLYKSTDNGQTWTKTRATPYSQYTWGNIFYKDDLTYYIIVRSALVNGIFLTNTTDGGLTWSPVTQIRPTTNTGFVFSFIDKNGTLYLSYSDDANSNFNYNFYENFANITIINYPPTASNLQLNPATPKTTDNLIATWSFNDAENNPEMPARIRWFKNNVLIPSLNDLITVASSNTQKGDKWNYTLQVYDGITYSALYVSPTISISNSMPTLSNIQLTSPAYTTTNLIPSWTFSDVDGDFQVSYRILWFKNGIIQASLNDSLSVSSTLTSRGELWNFTIDVFDGTNYSLLYGSNTIIVANSVPTVSNLQINTPANTTTDLTATWTYSDADNDLQNAIIIYWYKNSIIQAAFTNLTTILSSNTAKGDIWYFTIQAYDGFAYSTTYTSSSVTIQNSAPTASNLVLSPSNPNTTVTLVASWNYFDLDNDIASSPTIRWYKNGVLQSAVNDMTTVLSSYTARGEIWYFTLQVSDGTATSSVYTSSIVIIQNSAPTASNLQISNPVYTNYSISVSYTYFDADSDSESGTLILWYKDGILQASLNGSTSVSSTLTSKGQSWYYSLRVSDGTNVSVWYTSPSTTILNSIPTVSNLQISSPPLNSSDLTALYTYYDADGDIQSQFGITWFKNNIQQASYDNLTTVSNTATNIGEQWKFSVWVFDGTDQSITYTSPVTTIIADNSPFLVTIPTNLSYIVGTTGNNLIWKVTDNNPTTYTLYIDGIVDQTTSWTSNVNVTISVDNLAIGIYNYTITFSDGDGFLLTNGVFVIVKSIPVAPNYVAPVNFSYILGLQANFTWSATDDNPTSFEVYKDGLLVNSSAWNNNTYFIEDVSGLSLGLYNFTVLLYDADNLWSKFTVFVNVLPVPKAPIIIVHPNDFSIPENTNSNISWTAIDDNPTTFQLIINGSIYNNTNWTNNSLLDIPFSGLSKGIYNFTIVFYDLDGLSTVNTVFVTVIYYSTPFILETPQILNFNGSFIGNLTWLATDDNPSTYTLIKNGTIYTSGDWKSNQPISIFISQLSPGTYNFTLTLHDLTGLTISNEIFLIVNPVQKPIFNTIPSDLSYSEGSTGNKLSWLVSDNNPSSYTVTKEGVVLISGAWSSGIAIVVDIDGFTAGTYNLTITVRDLDGFAITDSVIITVTTSTTAPTSQTISISTTSSIPIQPTTSSNNVVITTSPSFEFLFVLFSLLLLIPIRILRNKKN